MGFYTVEGVQFAAGFQCYADAASRQQVQRTMFFEMMELINDWDVFDSNAPASNTPPHMPPVQIQKQNWVLMKTKVNRLNGAMRLMWPT